MLVSQKKRGTALILRHSKSKFYTTKYSVSFFQQEIWRYLDFELDQYSVPFFNVLNVDEFELGQCADGPGPRHGLGSVQSGHHIACSAPLLRDTRYTPPAAGTPDPGALRTLSLTDKSRGFSKLQSWICDCFFTIQSWYFCDSDIAHRACYEHSVHFVAQCAALSNYPGSSLVTSPGARLSLASLARPGAGGEYANNVQPGILCTGRV